MKRLTKNIIYFPHKIYVTSIDSPLDYRQKCIDTIYNLGDQMIKKTNVKGIMSSYFIWQESDVFHNLLTEIEKTILELLSNYPKWQLKTKSYKNTLNKSCSQYERLFIRLLESRDLIKRYRNKKFSFYKDWWLRFKL